MKKIKVLVTDDSIFFRKLLMDGISNFDDIEIVGYAVNSFDAKTKIPILKPDVLTLDIEMPGMNGIEFVKQLMSTNPMPVVLVSSLNINTFDALSVGAVDFVRKPDVSVPNSSEAFFEQLHAKIRIASFSKPKPKKTLTDGFYEKNLITAKTPTTLDNTLIAIGASTGGTEATLEVLKDLPEDTPGIVIVQHMPVGFTKMYADRLNNICKMEVKEAENGDKVRRGLVLIARGDKHLKVIRIGSTYTVQYIDSEKVSGHKPSVDVLFDSVAKSANKNAIGIILTGMGADGARGLLKMKMMGAYTIGQDKNSCVVYGMPMEANKLGAVDIEASCEDIPNLLLSHLNSL